MIRYPESNSEHVNIGRRRHDSPTRLESLRRGPKESARVPLVRRCVSTLHKLATYQRHGRGGLTFGSISNCKKTQTGKAYRRAAESEHPHFELVRTRGLTSKGRERPKSARTTVWSAEPASSVSRKLRHCAKTAHRTGHHAIAA